MKGAGPGAPLRYRRASRIRRSSEIRELLRRGRRRRTAHFEIVFRASPTAHPRFGMIVPKHRHTAVERNRLRRRIREVGRTVVLPLARASECTLDFLVRARAGAYDLAFGDVKSELEAAALALCSNASS